ncbi:MAG: flavodoxin family protein [Spirochaetae bacterium HGW-Spirochaetae-1]|jgi:multimeric flavodoxin WrbA|nr:MAG: flavodoxin family protein [Spirochaetae bacterium HGW-Spirochaetae-1]
MKVVAFNGSPRAEGNTNILINIVFDELKKEGIECETVHIGRRLIRGCAACYKCFEKKDGHCIFNDDIINECIDKMRDAQGIILGSPTYFSNVTTEMKALIDRAGMVGRANTDLYRRKVGASVVAVRRSGANHVFSSLNYFFLIAEMIIPGSNYWNSGVGRNIGDVEQDEEGVQVMRTLGQNMAWLMEKLY